MTTENFKISPIVRLGMLAARNNGILGKRAYQKVFDQSPQDLRSIAIFCNLLADEKEGLAELDVELIDTVGEAKC